MGGWWKGGGIGGGICVPPPSLKIPPRGGIVVERWWKGGGITFQPQWVEVEDEETVGSEVDIVGLF